MSLVSQYPRLAGPQDIPRLVSGDHVHHEWPPPGTTVLSLGFPETWVEVNGSPAAGQDGDWWVTDLATIALKVGATETAILASLGQAFTGPIVPFVGTVGRWPVIYTQGEGSKMRWIKSTIRGTLAGVEQFQFGINWGNPGDDPDPNPAETLAFAQSLADTLQSTLATSYSAITPISMFPTDVKFTEVGAVVCEETSATASDGSGGDLTQKFDTQWAAYPVGSLPTGGASSVSLPFEVSMGVTLQTDHRGPSGRGRLYLPPFGVGYVQAGGKFTDATRSAAGQWIGDLLAQMSSSSGHVPVIVSRRRLILNEVTSVNVGAVPDSQRRRRRSQDEARVTEWTKP